MLLIVLECTLSAYNKKKFAVTQRAVLCRQQPYTSRVYHISCLYYFLLCLIYSRVVFCSNMLHRLVAKEQEAVYHTAWVFRKLSHLGVCKGTRRCPHKDKIV